MFITSRVDYLAGSPKIMMDRLECILNAAACVASQTRQFDRGPTRLLHTKLHWLNVLERVQYKLGVTVHRCMQHQAPQYLDNCCIACGPPTSPVVNVFAPPAAVSSTCQDITRSSLVVGLSPRQPPSSGTPYQLSSTTSCWVLTPLSRLWRLISSRCTSDTSALGALCNCAI